MILYNPYMIEFLKTKTSPNYNLREPYLRSLPESQEFFLEQKISSSKTLLIEVNGERQGYAIIDSKKTLLEFFIDDEALILLPDIFHKLLAQERIQNILCKSFDKQLLFSCLSQSLPLRTKGFLFRKIVCSKHLANPDLIVRSGTLNDTSVILEINDGFFEGSSEIESYIIDDNARLFLLLNTDETLLGCGIAKEVIPKRQDFDIGMLVAKPYRRKGYGTYILSYLKNYFLTQNMKPIAGCGDDNIGSLHSLQKAGFATEHRILEFSVS